MKVSSIISGASNIKGGQNPPFTSSDFCKQYPQFFSADEMKTPLIPEELLESYINLAHSSIKESRYHKAWNVCMGLFVAHFVTLYLQGMANPAFGGAGVASAGQTKGMVASKAVDGVSVSYDYSQTLSDLDGWANWKGTAFGVQLATLAKLYGMGGMYVY